MRRAAICAALLSLVMTASAAIGTAGIPRPILPVPDHEFQAVVLVPDREATERPGPEDAPLLIDPRALMPSETVLERPVVAQRAPEPGVEPRGAPQTTIHGLVRLIGWSSWYCRRGRSVCHRSYPDRPGEVDLYAAAGPKLRAAICGVQSCTSWRGKYVYVNGTRVRLIDWCQCYWKRSNEKVIDLYWDAWVKTGGGKVSIGW